MKTKNLTLKLFAGAALALGTGLTIPTAISGPGPDHWRNSGKTENSAIVAPVVPMTHTARGCTDARLMSVTETKTMLANGRGPMQTIEVGKKLACTSCDTPKTVMKASWHNGRGPLASVAIKGTHDCSKSGCTPGTSVATVD